jgi:hypothetical protein
MVTYYLLQQHGMEEELGLTGAGTEEELGRKRRDERGAGTSLFLSSYAVSWYFSLLADLFVNF